MAVKAVRRRMPVGAEVLGRAGVHFRVWAPERKQVLVVLRAENEAGSSGPSIRLKLEPEAEGYFAGLAAAGRPGMLYHFLLDDNPFPFPDPVSRFQPEGPMGPSQIVDPQAFAWSDEAWGGVKLEGQVIYELHMGTFTREGTWAAAAQELSHLAELGVTLLELMPVADFPGRYGWGYDGVDLFAPTRLYGRPDQMRAFVNQAHALGLGVILDVVYNHVGPAGNYLKDFSPYYFTDKYTTDWGEAINYDGTQAGPVREFFIHNAGYWIEEFHLDGLRLDATQNIYDDSPEHIMMAIGRRVREAAHGRSTLIIAENEPQHTQLVRPPEQGGYGLDALWNDDFHHTAMVALTGRSEAYYMDYGGSPQEFISAVKYGYLYQGQYYAWQKKRRGTPSFGIKAPAFVTFIQNHDQIANSFRGDRGHTLASPGCYRAMTALMLLAPGTPMLFMGQEFAASTPFLFFADHGEDLARMIFNGRAEFLSQFRSMACREVQLQLNDPLNPETFIRSKLDHSERERHADAYALHRDLLRLRREDPVFRAQRADRIDGSVLGPEAFVLRYFGEQGDDRLLIVNFGRDLFLEPAPEPLLAPPEERDWAILWSTEDPGYGGCGTAPLEDESNWHLPGHAALVLIPRTRE